MSLGDFLGDQSLGSWADEMEDAPMPGAASASTRPGYGGDRPSYASSGGFNAGFGADRGASFADRGFAFREELPMPSKPPYTAHLGNLSFDATEGDVTDFFSGCDVTHVRIVEDKLDRKPKGFGYVEFGSVDGLKKALDLSGSQFQGRNIRVSVAEPPKDRVEAREITDWTRKGPLPDLPGQRRNADRPGFGADADTERGDRRRPPPYAGDGKERDFGNWERKGPLSPGAAAGGAPGEGGRPKYFEGGAARPERRQSPAWGEGQGDAGARGPRRDFQPSERPPPERQPTAPELDNQWRTKMRPDPAAQSPTATPEASTPSSPAPPPAAPAGRPRLNLAKRTVSENQPAQDVAPSDKPNPFGAARPIDTAAREKEIEEKRQLAIRQKKEADKAKEEKRAKEAAEKAAAKDSTSAATPSTEEKEDATEQKPNSSSEVPQQATNTGRSAGQDADAGGKIIEDKAVKPQEIVREPAKHDGSWRRKPATPTAPAGSTAETLDEDGWSTVTKPVKSAKNNNRRGGSGAPARAIAS